MKWQPQFFDRSTRPVTVMQVVMLATEARPVDARAALRHEQAITDEFSEPKPGKVTTELNDMGKSRQFVC